MEHKKQYNDILTDYARYQEIAKGILKPSCYVCKDCDGRACAGRFTNILEFGAKGNNEGFMHAVRRLRKIKIHLDPIHEEYDPDPSCELFGKHFDLPVFASPIGKLLTVHSIDSPYFNANAAYADALVRGCYEAGAMAWLGDNKQENYLEEQVASIAECDGVGVPTIKPWANRSEYWRKLEVAKDSGAMAVSTDVDAIGLGYQYSGPIENRDDVVSSRGVKELTEMVKRAEIPFVVKGVMTARAAAKAVEAGAYGILISNHGGNITESSTAPCDMVREIKREVGSSIKVLVDGGVRSGEDVFRLLALGADAVGIGRPYVQALYGGGKDGVYTYTQKIYWELVMAMRLADCRTLADITEDKITIQTV
ncbi:MAG: alpha-hydroxy-acid oxidizing protein [Sphaerochaeta sp.]|jgi:4-hydroxymandelate oxidase